MTRQKPVYDGWRNIAMRIAISVAARTAGRLDRAVPPRQYAPGPRVTPSAPRPSLANSGLHAVTQRARATAPRVPWSEGPQAAKQHPSWRPAPYRDASSWSRSVSLIESRSVSLMVSTPRYFPRRSVHLGVAVWITTSPSFRMANSAAPWGRSPRAWIPRRRARQTRARP